MNGPGHQTAVRCQHKTAKLGIDCHIAHTSWNKNLLIYLADTLTDRHNIVRLLLRAIWDSDSAGQVDKGNVRTGLLFQLDSQLKQNLCQHRIILVSYRIACEECVHTEVLRTLFL